MYNDPLDEESRRLLCVPPAQRDAAMLEATIQLTNKHALDFFSTITAAQHMALRVLLEQSDHRSRGPELRCPWVGIRSGLGLE